MASTIEKFIKSCARGAFDPQFIVTKPDEWLQIINFQGGELFPDIGYRGQTTVLVVNIGNDTQVDLSAETGIYDVKEVWLIDSNGKEQSYSHWLFNRETLQLDVNPVSAKAPVNFWEGFISLKIVWYGFLPTFTKFSETIQLPSPKLVLLEKICIRESLRRVLMDHTKLDRFRTLVSRINEYALIAIVRDYTTDIEITKRRISDTNQIRSF